MLQHLIFGNLTLNDIPYNVPIILGTAIAMGIITVAILGIITYYKQWTYLWKEWITTTDHKKIGVMYIILAGIMLLRGFSDAIMMRSQQAIASASAHSAGYLPPEHFDQIFTAHGVIMIFFMAMPFMFGLLNLVVPLQIGARDVAYPYLNSLSFWLTTMGAMLVMISLVVGKFAATGWLAYPPLSGIQYSPGVGVDYYIWAIQISGVGSLLSGVNFFATIIKMRCPGMTMMKMPVFTWTALCAMILVMLAFPILTVTLAMLALDRYIGMHFFTTHLGGNMMMYVNLIWAWGHPEVYILILPAFGAFSEIVPTFARKKLFGYATMVWATIAITFLSFVVWLHHFFTMGAGADVNAFFGIATMVIAIPTGVKVFNWLFTMYRGQITFSTPMLWTMGFMITFVVGGMTGVLMSLPAVDFQMHNSVFLVAHFHNVIIGGVVFGYFAGLIYWFPKIFGFKLNETLGKYAFGFWTIGFYVAFMPLYAAGMLGMTRRLDQPPEMFHGYLVVAAIGSGLIAIGIFFQILQLVVSIKNRNQPGYKAADDAWENGRTLEWSIPSPVPFYNFAFTPKVDSLDQHWANKERSAETGTQPKMRPYEDIHMPKNTSIGFIIGAFAGLFGFAAIWQMPLLLAGSFAGIIITTIVRTFNPHPDYYVKASEVEAIESKHNRGRLA